MQNNFSVMKIKTLHSWGVFLLSIILFCVTVCFESTGMLAQGRKKSYIKAVCKALDIRPGRIKMDSADALFLFCFIYCPISVGGPVVIKQRVCVKTTGVILLYDFLNPLTVIPVTVFLLW